MTLRPTVSRLAGALAGLTLALAGCAGYEYTLNARTVFEGPRLFTGYAIADAALGECVAQAISDQRITHAEALEDLNCAHAGIASVAGLEVFTGLRRVRLDDNAITDLAPLHALRALELLQVRGNRLRTLDVALCQGAAKKIALMRNEQLDCAAVDRLRACGATIVDLPAHCTAGAR